MKVLLLISKVSIESAYQSCTRLSKEISFLASFHFIKEEKASSTNDQSSWSNTFIMEVKSNSILRNIFTMMAFKFPWKVYLLIVDLITITAWKTTLYSMHNFFHFSDSPTNNSFTLDVKFYFFQHFI